jgi:hypothetical protein
MTRWYSRVAEQASFKPVPGGYLFPAPHPWIFAKIFTKPRTYLVNEAQKAQIAECLRRRQQLMLALAAVFLPLIAVLTGLLLASDRLPSGMVIAIAAVLLLITLMIPHLYLVRAIAPLIGGLSPSDQRVTGKEQFAAIAGAASPATLKAGMAGGASMVLGGVIGFADAMAEGAAGVRLYAGGALIVVGAICAAYFVVLARLKAHQPRHG